MGSMTHAKCSVCNFDFDDGVYLMKNRKDYICIFCLKKKPDIDISELFDNRQLRMITDLLDREGCIELLGDLL